jgi:lipoyl(octanoyl) transferase
MRFLEEAVILTLKDFGIESGRVDGLTGVWIEGETKNARKICAMGVKSSRWVTMHGIGFNINTDLNFFSHIIPCGIDDKAVTSMQRELGREMDINEISRVLQNHLAKLFDFTTKSQDHE